VVAYSASGEEEHALQQQGIVVHALGAGSKLAKLRAVRRWAGEFQPEIMHGFMKRASGLAVLANLPLRRSRIVGSDMSTASYGRRKPELWGALALFTLADLVVTQTEMNRRSLGRMAPWLRRRIRIVRNGVDTHKFQPMARPPQAGPFRFICVGTVYGVKNPVRVVEAVRLLAQECGGTFRLDWYGRRGMGGPASCSSEYHQAVELVARYGLEPWVTFHGPIHDIERVYPMADAVVHASLQEGIPNAVVEAMASGLPIVVSRVSDLPLLVETAQNGFVCDERSPDSIAQAMRSMLETGPAERDGMRVRSRDLAVQWFGRERFISDFEELYQSLLRGT
jgi:glycosyltransferase involved in cell wall biosynthesis